MSEATLSLRFEVYVGIIIIVRAFAGSKVIAFAASAIFSFKTAGK